MIGPVEINLRSAEGAKYDSQASDERSEERRPWELPINNREALKERNSQRPYFALSVLPSIDPC